MGQIRSEASNLRDAYNSVMPKPYVGYEPAGGAQVDTKRQLLPALRQFVGKELLEDKIPNSFNDVPKFFMRCIWIFLKRASRAGTKTWILSCSRANITASEWRFAGMIPITWEGCVAYDVRINPDVLIKHLAQQLRTLDARNVETSGNSVWFTGGLFRTTGRWNILNGFGRGQLIVDEVRHVVEYRLSAAQLVTVASTMFVTWGCVSGLSLSKDHDLLFFLLFSWLLAIGGILLFGLPRFRRFLQQAVDAIPVVGSAEHLPKKDKIS